MWNICFANLVYNPASLHKTFFACRQFNWHVLSARRIDMFCQCFKPQPSPRLIAHLLSPWLTVLDVFCWFCGYFTTCGKHLSKITALENCPTALKLITFLCQLEGIFLALKIASSRYVSFYPYNFKFLHFFTQVVCIFTEVKNWILIFYFKTTL